MSKSWIRSKLNEFARDVLRDFCLAAQELEDRFQEYDATGKLDFHALRYLVGDEMDKGLLWRLKDTAHHVFRNDPEDPVIGRFLDWGLGYIFHETMKLKEDAYQQQNYAPWFRQASRRELPEVEGQFCNELTQILEQTKESISREVTRIRFITDQCRSMFGLYYSRHSDNHLLARFLFAQNDLVREVFADRYDDLIRAIYADQPQTLYVLAALSLRQGGWAEEAERALTKARELAPDDPRIDREQEQLAQLIASQRRREVVRQ